MIFIDPKYDTNYYLVYFGIYYPVHHPKFDSFSRTILNIKYRHATDPASTEWKQESKQRAIKYFYERLNPLIASDVVITVVPSHKHYTELSGVQELAKKLIENNRINGINCLIRFKDIQKQAHGGVRSIEQHLQTIKVQQPDLISGKEVLLMDDVVTTGCSLRACKQLLMEKGALRVKCVSLAKTVTTE
jgi:predicted amidophosphoribosyltransferase